MIRPRTGTRPGDPIADLIFACGYAVIQVEFAALLRENGLMGTIPMHAGGIFSVSVAPGDCSAVGLPPVNYMDDTAFVIMAECPSQLIPRLALAACLFVRTCRRHGLEVNFGPGKTEALVRFGGEGSRLAVAEVNTLEVAESEDGPAFLLPLADGGVLRIVQHCRHLGSEVTLQNGLHRELAARASAASVAMSALSRSLLAKSSLPATMRTMVARACVHSSALYLSGVWSELSSTQMARIGPAFYRPFRIIVGVHKPGPQG